MREDLKQKIIDDLNEGKFIPNQTADLKQGDTFCFLGYVNELYRIEKDKGYWEVFNEEGSSVFVLPKNVPTAFSYVDILEWAGLDEVDELDLALLFDEAADEGEDAVIGFLESL